MGAPHAAGCMWWLHIPATLPPPTDPVIRGGTHQVICIALSISHYHQAQCLSSSKYGDGLGITQVGKLDYTARVQ